MKFTSDFAGSCKIKLVFEDPGYFQYFYLISLATIVLLLVNILIKF